MNILPAVQYAVAALTIAATSASIAQEQYPSQPIKIIVGFPAGGGNDITARLVGEHLRKILGQSVVVDNRPGASGMIATDIVAKSRPDGYTLLLASGEIAVNPHLYSKMAYDWDKDLATISLLVKTPSVLVVHADVPAKNVAELIAYAKNNQGKLTFSSAGIGNPQQLAGELFNKMAGVKINHVPYKGGAAQLAGVAGKHVTMTFSSFAVALPHIESGKLRPIAVTSLSRVSMMPDVPAIAEHPPLAGYELINFMGLYGPADLPDPILRKINAATVQALKTPEVGGKLTGLGLLPSPSTPEQLREFLRAETKKYGRIIVDADVKIEQ